MVDKVNGRVEEGLWFSADVRFATLVVTNGDFVDDAAGNNNVNANGLDKVIEAVQTRATVVGLTVTNATTLQLILDFGQAYDKALGVGVTDPIGQGQLTDAQVIAEVEALIDDIDLSGALPVAGPDLSAATFSNVGTTFAAA